MRDNVLLSAFLGFLCIYGVHGMLPLLGENVNHPLFFFGPQHLIQLFDMNSTLGQTCFDNVGFSAMTALTGIFRCAAEMAPDVSNGPPSLTSMCGTMPKFSTCFHEEAMSVAETCRFTEKQRMFITNAVENNRKITEDLCDNGGMAIIQYQINDGMSCAEQKRGNIIECLDYQDPSEMMMYDTEGCRKAKLFIECASTHIGECNDEAGAMVEDLMEDSLKSVCAHRGAGQLPPGMRGSGDSSEEDMDGGRDERSKKHMFMKKQIELLEEIRDSLQSVVGALLRHEEILQAIAQK